MGLISLGAGVAIGYVIGTKSGKEKLEKGIDSVKRTADETWNDPKVQDFVHRTSDSASKVAHEAAQGAKRTATAAADAWRNTTAKAPEAADAAAGHGTEGVTEILEEVVEEEESRS